jgi:hypothetical protein
MRLTPRKPEVEAVVQLLESQDYATADALAKDIIKTVADMLDMRDWVALGHRWHGGQSTIAWGPFSSEIEALRVAEYVGVGGRFATVKLYSPGVLIGNARGRKNTAGFCRDERCGHAPFTHSMATSARGPCLLESCTCPRFEK